LVEYTGTLWLMLIGVWIRSNADTLYYILFSRHQDRAIWLGDLMYLIPSFGCNALLVPLIGFKGIGLSAIISSSYLIVWRGWHVIKKTGIHSMSEVEELMPPEET
jgi:O-antigen/teichoic acid export membrane protein